MKLFLAPIQGMTTAIYRNFHEEIFGGIDAYYAPFIVTSPKGLANPKHFKDILPENNSVQHTLIPQLMGNNGPDFRSHASVLSEMGYPEINWNIGCPYPMVTKKKKGAGLLPYPDLIEQFLDEVCLDTRYDLSVKMRLGLHDAAEGLQVIRLLNQYPLKGVIIHGRTGMQKYSGSVDLDSFEALFSSSRHTITYNGDLFSQDDLNRLMDRFPSLNQVMLGRGVLRNPFLPSELKGVAVPTADRMIKIRHFHDLIFAHYSTVLSGEKHLCDRMYEFWSYLSFPLDPSGKYLKELKKCRSITTYHNLVNRLLRSAQW